MARIVRSRSGDTSPIQDLEMLALVVWVVGIVLILCVLSAIWPAAI